jgi:hypothetical protein
VTPTGFGGFFVSFSVRGIDAVVLLLDGRQMRWLAWWENAFLSTFGTTTFAAVENAGLEIAHWLERDRDDRRGAPHDIELPPSIRFYPPVPEPVVELPVLWRHAHANARPRVEGIKGDFVIAPDIITGPRIVAAAPKEPLVLQEPFLLQRRLDAAEGCGWPGFAFSKSEASRLRPGEYVWATGPYGQLRIAPFERVRGGSSTFADFGPSVLFFGRSVSGAGFFSVTELEGESRIDTVNAYAGEYALSVLRSESTALARESGRILFPRVGHLLPHLPGPREGLPWPVLRTLPHHVPNGRWR